MRNRTSLLGFALFVVAAFGCAPKDEAASPSGGAPAGGGVAAGPAPKSLDQVASSAPAVLYFVKENCGSNPRAIPLVQSIYEANKDGGKFFVVMNTDEDSAARWAQANGATFPIIADPNKEIIGRYGIRSSQTGILVDKDLNETKRFAGFGRDVLEDMNASLAEGGTAATVDLSGAPASGAG